MYNRYLYQTQITIYYPGYKPLLPQSPNYRALEKSVLLLQIDLAASQSRCMVLSEANSRKYAELARVGPDFHRLREDHERSVKFYEEQCWDLRSEVVRLQQLSELYEVQKKHAESHCQILYASVINLQASLNVL